MITATPIFAVDARYATRRFSGIGRHTLNLLHGLVALPGDEAVAVVVDEQTVLGEALTGHARLRPIAVGGKVTSLRGQVGLARRLRRAGVRLLHSPDVFGPLVTPGLRHVVTLADVIPLTCRSQLAHSRKAQLAPLWRAWLRAQCRWADAVVTVSQHSADDIHRELGVPRSKLHVIYNSIVLGSAAAGGARSSQAGPPRVLYVGRRDPYKNVAGLVRAFGVARRRVPDVQLVIVGSTDPRYREAECEVQRLGLGDTVQFVGFTDDAELEQLYAGASLFAFPSLYEGFGLPPVEAMRYGVPVVSSNQTCMPEVLGDAARLVNPEDAEAFGHAIADVLSNPALADELRQRGLAHVQRYTPAEQARQTRALWQRVLDAPSSFSPQGEKVPAKRADEG